MKLLWETCYSETSDGRDAWGRVLTLEVGPFVFSLWLTRVR